MTLNVVQDYPVIKPRGNVKQKVQAAVHQQDPVQQDSFVGRGSVKHNKTVPLPQLGVIV